MTQKKNTKNNKKGRHFVFWVGTNLLLFVTARLAFMTGTRETAIMTLLLLLIYPFEEWLITGRTQPLRGETPLNFGF